MNYEEKYKQALERAMNLFVTNNVSALVIGEIFPELKESEDEKIRKVISGWIYTQPPSEFLDNGFSREEMLAWIEKQGKKLDADKVIEWMSQHICTACFDEPNEAISLRIDEFKKDFEL